VSADAVVFGRLVEGGAAWHCLPGRGLVRSKSERRLARADLGEVDRARTRDRSADGRHLLVSEGVLTRDALQIRNFQMARLTH
jgi:hypothetical protein